MRHISNFTVILVSILFGAVAGALLVFIICEDLQTERKGDLTSEGVKIVFSVKDLSEKRELLDGRKIFVTGVVIVDASGKYWLTESRPDSGVAEEKNATGTKYRLLLPEWRFRNYAESSNLGSYTVEGRFQCLDRINPQSHDLLSPLYSVAW
jgi:hypothetical protein